MKLLHCGEELKDTKRTEGLSADKVRSLNTGFDASRQPIFTALLLRILQNIPLDIYPPLVITAV